MAEIHALKQTRDKKKVSFVFHFETPTGTNAASIDYKDCVKGDIDPQDSIVPNLENDNPTEHAKVLTGEVYEQTVDIKFRDTMTNNEKLTAAQSRWTELNTAFQADVPIIYKFFRMAETVP